MCYLASGRPVLVQDTGLDKHVPTGKGLLTFTTLEEAVQGIESINADYAAHTDRRGLRDLNRARSPKTKETIDVICFTKALSRSAR